MQITSVAAKRYKDEGGGLIRAKDIFMITDRIHITSVRIDDR